MRKEPGSLGRLWHAASPGSSLGKGLPSDTEPQAFVQVQWFLGGFAGEAWAMASGTAADESEIALKV